MEYGSQTILTEAMLRAMHSEALKASVARSVADAMVTRLVYDGTKVVKLDEYQERDVSLRAWEINDIVQAEEDPRMVAVVAKMERRQMAFLETFSKVNRLPLWRLAWLKIRRQPLIGVAG